ncbi:MAG: hypothetical protein JWM99_4228 [Verrucomicrobiales bacterium]|nr:hypothetical protein [Verrucomicrobiales bacterium]
MIEPLHPKQVRLFLWAALPFFLLFTMASQGSTNDIRPQLALVDAANQALTNNPTLRQALLDLKANQGIVIQTRAVVLPRLETIGNFKERAPELIDRTIEQFVPLEQTEHLWSTEVRLIQSVYQGGRLTSALRTAKLLREKALLDYQSLVSDVLLQVRIAYADVLAAEQKVGVSDSTMELLSRQLQNSKHRFDNDLEPRFTVLRAEVELENARPALIQSQNALRIARQQLLHLLGYDLTHDDSANLSFILTDSLKVEPFSMEVDQAIQSALKNRAELLALQKDAALRKEGIITARAGYKPTLDLFGTYGTRNSEYRREITDRLTGWSAGVQASWVPFDGLLTKGKVDEAKARYEKSLLQSGDFSQQIILNVRTAFSFLTEAKELLQSQEKALQQAEETLRLANVRQENGSSTQLDVLSAQSALTQARYVRADALRNYVVSLARLERAIGR